MTATTREGAALGLVTAALDDPTGYGRILRDARGRVVAIREQKDCSRDERAIHEVNPGLYAVDAGFLREAIAALGDDNAQGEFYLTDVVAAAAKQGRVVDVPGDMRDLRGVNDRADLAECARVRRDRIVAALAAGGVGFRDPSTVWIDAECVVEADAFVDAGVQLRGRCVVRAGAHIDAGAVLTDTRVEANATVLPYTVTTDATLGAHATVGPFSHLRPGTVLGPGSKVGNFSETKKTRVGAGSKVNHLSYVGDGDIGEGVNIGAGTIFCNYDGFEKHTTVLEDGVFIGSDSQLVAPVRVGRGAYVASGTTVTRDVPPDALAIARTRQQNKEGFAARLRERLGARKSHAKAPSGRDPGEGAPR